MIQGKRIVSLCISRLHDIENSRFIMELSRLLDEQGCSLWIYNINTDLYWNDDEYNAETSVFDLIDYENSDAIIIMDEKIKSRSISDKIIRRANAAAAPVILVDGSHPDCTEVHIDYAAGFEEIVRHVLDVHHIRKPHFMGGAPDNPFSEERLAMFKKVIAEHDIPFSENMVSYGYFWAKPAKACAEEIVRRPELPDAILCANDIMAINVCAVLNEHGIRVPEDIIVTGFDGMDEIYFASPSITSALCGTSCLSKAVFQAAMDAMGGVAPEKQYTVKPQLILNCSCGCQNGDHSNMPGHQHSFNDRFYRYQDDNRLLSDMCERMQTFSSIEDTAFTLYGSVLQDMCCLINQRCTDSSVDYFSQKRAQSFDDDMLLFFDSDQMPFVQREMKRSEYIPNLRQTMEKGYPLIFNALDFMNVPIGYVCFHFKEYEITDYCKVPQIVQTLSIGLGGFINRQFQHHLVAKIEAMYRYDSLTGLRNRLSFSKDFDHLRTAHGDKGIPLTVVMSDLDGLKTINDKFGHAAGDQAIAAVAQALRESCPSDALCVRFGGDEMIAVIPRPCDKEQLSRKIERWLDNYNMREQNPYKVTTSIGIITSVLRPDTDFEVLLHEADEMMYSIKQKRKQQTT